MTRRTLTMLGVVMALAAQPAMAETQTQAQRSSAAAEPDNGAMARLDKLYPVAPLTAEQQARLPAARALIAKVMPPGTMQKMMGAMFQRGLRPLMQAVSSDPKADIARRLGVSEDKLSVDPEHTQEVATLLDPAWQERNQRISDLIRMQMEQVMAGVEPALREAMSEIYAVHFDSKQLADLDVFFSTSTGAAYARALPTMTSDPRMIRMMMHAIPQEMDAFKDIDKRIAAATANLPKPRTYDQLTDAQRDRLAKLTGMSQDELKAALARDASNSGKV